MLNFGKNWLRQKHRRTVILKVLQEVRNNLEIFYVMRQLDQPRAFVLSSWQREGVRGDVPWPQVVQQYVQRLTEYNQAFQAAQDFECWYRQTIDHQNQEHARRLHTLQDAVNEKSFGLETLIQQAREAVQQLMPQPRIER
jgi:hypothetical protein